MPERVSSTDLLGIGFLCTRGCLISQRLLDFLEFACYPRRNGGTRQIGCVAFFDGRLRSVTEKKWQILHSGGAATTGAASAGLPDTSATEAALIAEVFTRFRHYAKKGDLVQAARKPVLSAREQRKAAVSAACLHLSLTAAELAQSSVFDA